MPVQFIQQLANGLVIGSIYDLVTLGISMAFGLMGIVNFAHGKDLVRLESGIH